MTTYQQHDRHLIAVDCIIFGFQDGELNLLLIRRDLEPYRGKWSLMGGFLLADESLDDAANRVLEELTNLKDVYLEQFHTFGQLERDPGERTVSTGYFALVDQAKASQQLSAEYSAHWVPVADVPPLIFDHNEMVRLALRRLRHRAKHEPVGFELLQERFTFTQLLKLYEAIFGQSIDPGNFRRRLRKMDYLEQLDEKDFQHSKRGSWYYRFDPTRYAEARSQGIAFLLKP